MGTFLEKKIFYLEKFIIYPDWTCKELNILIIVLAFCISARENKIRSSANRRCETDSLDLMILTDAQSSLRVTCSIKWVKYCIQIMKIYKKKNENIREYATRWFKTFYGLAIYHDGNGSRGDTIHDEVNDGGGKA